MRGWALLVVGALLRRGGKWSFGGGGCGGLSSIVVEVMLVIARAGGGCGGLLEVVAFVFWRVGVCGLRGGGPGGGGTGGGGVDVGGYFGVVAGGGGCCGSGVGGGCGGLLEVAEVASFVVLRVGVRGLRGSGRGGACWRSACWWRIHT